MIRSLLVGVALLAGSLHADVTVRYKADVTSPLLKLLPPDLASQVSSLLPFEVTTHLKDGRSSSQVGGFAFINNPETKQIILLDTAGKKYVKSSTEELLASLKGSVPPVPPVADAGGDKKPDMPKPKVESRLTGRSATVLGVDCEEREVSISMDAPPIPNMPPMGPGPFLKVVIQIWTSKAGEADRLPAIKEMNAIMVSGLAQMNPAKMFEAVPELNGDTMKTMLEMTKSGVLMKMKLDIYLPGLAPMLPMLPGVDTLGPDFDPKGSLVTLSQEVVELSTAPLAASSFAIPAQYSSETVDDFMKSAMARLTPPGK
jgi:hypothetical protein